MAHTSERIERVYNYIVAQWHDHHQIPTLREIANDCDISLTAVTDYLSILEGQGRITREPYQSRSIRLTEDFPTTNEDAELIYDYLEECLMQGNVPSRREIAEACFLSRGKVRQSLIWLQAKGRIGLGKGQRKLWLIDNE